jgi:hypothetical protein
LLSLTRKLLNHLLQFSREKGNNMANKKPTGKPVAKPKAAKATLIKPSDAANRPDSARSVSADLVLLAAGRKAMNGAKFVGTVPQTLNRDKLVEFLARQPAIKDGIPATTVLSLAVHRLRTVHGIDIKLDRTRAAKPPKVSKPKSNAAGASKPGPKAKVKKPANPLLA